MPSSIRSTTPTTRPRTFETRTETTSTLVTVSQYHYNDDGAPTAVDVTAGNAPPKTTFLTWDNFVPDATEPETGKVGKGNGNLVGYGSTPGGDYDAAFGYDAQNRMVSAVFEGQTSAYTFHPDSTLASSALSGDTYAFYYGNGKLVNVVQSSNQRASSRLGHLRDVAGGGDGVQQVLLQHRKDVVAAYDPSAGAVSPYDYDAYGNPGSEEPSAGQASYDLSENPFRFAGEYRDPLWGGYYLRSRWYEPRFQIFVSRDPAHNLNRYGYTDGNPVARIDPSGRSWKGFMAALGSHKPGFMILFGVGRLLAPWFFGPVEMFGEPAKFLRNVKTNHNGFDFFFFGGMVVNTLAAEPELDALLGVSGAFAGRSMLGAALGFGLPTAMAFHQGKFDWQSALAGYEHAIGDLTEFDGLAGHGKNDFNLNLHDVEQLAREVQSGARDPLVIQIMDTSYVSREIPFTDGVRPLAGMHGPLLEQLDLGTYHTQLVGITRDGIVLTDAVEEGVRRTWAFNEGPNPIADAIAEFESVHDAPSGRSSLELERATKFKIVDVGRAGDETMSRIYEANPTHRSDAGFDADPSDTSYHWRRNNCFHHVNGVLRMLRSAQ